MNFFPSSSSASLFRGFTMNLWICARKQESLRSELNQLSLSLFLSVATSQELPPDWSLAASLVPEIPDDVV